MAQVLANLIEIPQLAGTLNLPGPSTLSHEYLLELVTSILVTEPSKAPVVPKRIAQLIATFSDRFLWWPILSPDEVTRRFISDASHAGDWGAVGVTPSEIEHHALHYLRRYRAYENFSRPPVFPPRPSVSSFILVFS